MSTAENIPAGFEPLTHAGAFVDSVGPLYRRESDGVIGVRVDDRHLNVAGSAMGGFLATLVDVAFGRAIRAAVEGGGGGGDRLLDDGLSPAGSGRGVAGGTNRGRAVD